MCLTPTWFLLTFFWTFFHFIQLNKKFVIKLMWNLLEEFVDFEAENGRWSFITSSSNSMCASEAISINSMEARQLVILYRAQPNMENYSNIQKRMFTLLQPSPEMFAKTCRQLDTERKGYFPICIENQAIISSFAQDECKHTRMAGNIFSGEEKLFFTWGGRGESWGKVLNNGDRLMDIRSNFDFVTLRFSRCLRKGLVMCNGKTCRLKSDWYVE